MSIQEVIGLVGTTLKTEISPKLWVICLVGGLLAGGYVTRLYYMNEILTIEKNLSQENEKILKESNERLKKAIALEAELGNTRSDLTARISSLTSRVRVAESNLKAARASAATAISESHARCNQLLSRGTELVERNSRLLRDIAERNDKIVELVK